MSLALAHLLVQPVPLCACNQLCTLRIHATKRVHLNHQVGVGHISTSRVHVL